MHFGIDEGGRVKENEKRPGEGGKDLTTMVMTMIHHHSPLSFYTILNSLRPHKMIVEFFMGPLTLA